MQELPEIRVGASFVNLEDIRLRIKNPAGHKNDGNAFFAFNNRAWIMGGSIFTVIAIDGDMVLVRHQTPGQERALGTQAGNGALFLIQWWNFLRMTTQDLKIKAEDMERSYVELLLKRAEKE